MAYKLLPRYRGRFAVEPEFVEPRRAPRASARLDIHVKPPTRSHAALRHRGRGDAQLLRRRRHGAQQPETTTGGKALKFYSSVRLDVRRIETLKDGTDAVGNRTRVKVVKNKVSPPFKQAEFDILYGRASPARLGLIDMGVEHGFVRKAGAWYTYDGDQLGQGKENARAVPARQPRPRRRDREARSRRSSASARRPEEPAVVAEVPVDF
jgi:recombination protein RecA